MTEKEGKMEIYDTYCCFRNKNEKAGARILWEVTSRCNMRCSFCHVSPKKECSFEEIQKIISKLKQIRVKDIIVSGGEPLVREDIFNILDLLKENNFELDFCTNATLITEENAKILKNYLSEISVSLDSIDEEHLNLLGNKEGICKQVIQGIKTLVASGHVVHLICTVNKKNCNILRKIMNAAEGLGVHSITFLGLVENNIFDKKENKNTVLSKEQMEMVRKEITSMRKETKGLIINSKRIFPRKQSDFCQAGRGILGISSEGMLYSCILHQEKGYDLLSDSFSFQNTNFDRYTSCIK